MRSETSRSTCATVRIFATLPGASTPIPRRGTVKVWTATAERTLATALGAVVEGASGMIELSLDLDDSGRLVNVEVSTSSGDDGIDGLCLEALKTSPELPAPPAQLREAAVLVLAEFTALERMSA